MFGFFHHTKNKSIQKLKCSRNDVDQVWPTERAARGGRTAFISRSVVVVRHRPFRSSSRRVHKSKQRQSNEIKLCFRKIVFEFGAALFQFPSSSSEKSGFWKTQFTSPVAVLRVSRTDPTVKERRVELNLVQLGLSLVGS